MKNVIFDPVAESICALLPRRVVGHPLKKLFLLLLFVATAATSAVATPDLGFYQTPSASPNPVTAGNAVSINFNVGNYGNTTSSSSTTKIIIHPAGSTSVVAQNYFATPAIAPNFYNSQSCSLTIPGGTAAGSYTALIILDNYNTAGQTNYSNDQYTVSFSVTGSNPAPSISSVNGGNPVTADPGNAAQTISLSGSNFVSKPTVYVTWTGGSKTLSSSQVTFVSSTQLQMSIQLGVTADTWTVRVTNPDTQPSNTASFSVVGSNPAPSISSVNGASAVTADPGNAAQTINISGSNFVSKPTLYVTWSTGNKTLSDSEVTFVSSTQLQMNIKLGAVADTWTVRVTNPSGQQSNTASFSVVRSQTPVLSVTPLSASVGAAVGTTSFAVSNSGGGTMNYSTGSPNVSWLHVTSGGTGGNSGTVNVSYDANAGAQRSGSVQITANGASGSPATINITQLPSGTSTSLKFDRDKFFQQLAVYYISPSDQQKLGINRLLDFIEVDTTLTADTSYKHLRWVAYMLGTTRHETNRAYAPVEEGYVTGPPAFTLRPGSDPYIASTKDDYFNHWYQNINGNGNYASNDGYTYRGRGYVQITGRANYQKLGTALQYDLIGNPDLAADPNLASYQNDKVAYQIMSYGMQNGSFTGQTLESYITDTTTDAEIATAYLNARRIVNGYVQSQAEDVRDAAINFEAILRNSQVTGTTSPDATPPTISAFGVTPSSATVGQGITINYTASDTGGSGLQRVILRRTSGDGSAYDPGWQAVQTYNVSGDLSGTFTDTPPDVGTYWYGLGVFDSAGNSTNEGAAGLGPKQVTVTGGKISSVSPSPQSGASATVGQSLPVSVSVGAEIATAGVLQVTIFDTVLKQDWVYISGAQSTVRTFNPPALTSTTAGQVQYNIQAKFRPGATSGPLTTSNPNDVDSSISYAVNWQNTAPQTGSLQVSLSPAGAVSAGAQWQVDSGAWQSSGGTVSGLSAGSHAVSFKTVSGWTSPSSQTVTVNANQTTSASGTYVSIPATGSLMVSISPPGAVSTGAQWQVDGGAWQSSGATAGNLSVGNHAISFSTVNGWTTPSNQSVTVNANQTTSASGTYVSVPATGSMTVTISPPGAVSAGAQWQVDSGTMRSSGATVSGLSTGNHTVSFSTVSGYTTPSSQTVSVNANQTAAATGTYVVNSQTGSLQVTISPADAVSAGAQWQVDGGAWQSSGATVSRLTTGSHTVSYKAINGWTSPANQTITVNANQTATVNGAYTTVSTPTGLFSDDFNDNSMDPAKWTASGNTVTEAGQVMQVLTTVTDAGGNLSSVAFPISQSGVITITRKAFLHYANNYFGAFMNVQISGLPKFGIHYENYEYSGPDDVVRHGFYITRNDANSHGVAGQTDTSAAINPVWDTWFNEKVTYNPSTGDLEYFINGVSQIKYNVGILPQSTANTMALSFNAWGWYTGHQQLFDDLTVEQAPPPATATYAFLNVQANPASAGSVSGGGNFLVGSTQQISASAVSGWVFTGWDGGNTQNPRTITIADGGNAYTAEFAPQTAILTIQANPSAGGTVSGGGTFAIGSSQSITATANPGWQFVSWNDGDVSSTRTVVVPVAGGSYVANFAALPPATPPPATPPPATPPPATPPPTPALVAPLITSPTTASGQRSLPFTYKIDALNSPTSYAEDGLPGGLSFDPASGVITGVPTQLGTFLISLSASNAAGTGTATLTLIIAEVLPVATLTSVKPTVTIGSNDVGELTINLSAPSDDVVIVNYSISGTANNGADYVFLNGVKKFKPGTIRRPVKIVPVGDLAGAAKKTVKITLESGVGYTVGTTAPVKMKILRKQ